MFDMYTKCYPKGTGGGTTEIAYDDDDVRVSFGLFNGNPVCGVSMEMLSGVALYGGKEFHAKVWNFLNSNTRCISSSRPNWEAKNIKEARAVRDFAFREITRALVRRPRLMRKWVKQLREGSEQKGADRLRQQIRRLLEIVS